MTAGKVSFCLIVKHSPDNFDYALREMCEALSRTDDPDFIEEFLRSLLTPGEKDEIASRWALVRMMEGGVTQREIAQRLGLSLCKITRGSRELKAKDSAFRKMITIFKAEGSGLISAREDSRSD